MGHRSVIAAFILAASISPLQAEQSQAYFSQAVDVCLRYSPDGFFVADRLEEAGWSARYDADYQATILSTPGATVWVIPPPEGGSVPSHCTVVSGTVGIIQADAAVRFVLGDGDIAYREGTVAGCTAFETAAGTQIRIFSDGQDDFCADPASARVDVVTFVDGAAGQ